jgi:hypothetical protein
MQGPCHLVRRLQHWPDRCGSWVSVSRPRYVAASQSRTVLSYEADMHMRISTDFWLEGYSIDPVAVALECLFSDSGSSIPGCVITWSWFAIWWEDYSIDRTAVPHCAIIWSWCKDLSPRHPVRRLQHRPNRCGPRVSVSMRPWHSLLWMIIFLSRIFTSLLIGLNVSPVPYICKGTRSIIDI